MKIQIVFLIWFIWLKKFLCLFIWGADWEIEQNRIKYECNDLNAKDAYGQTPIYIAARNGIKNGRNVYAVKCKWMTRWLLDYLLGFRRSFGHCGVVSSYGCRCESSRRWRFFPSLHCFDARYTDFCFSSNRFR